MATKTGTNGDDMLYGGGPDTLVGLAGADTYAVYSALDVVQEEEGQGNDRVLTFANYALGAGASVETLSTAINSDTAPLTLTGNALSQVIVGNFGANTLDGMGGGDAMAGLRGDDTYRVYGRNDAVVENQGEGVDRVLAYGDFVLGSGASVEAILAGDAAGTTPLFLGGNALTQAITGNAGANLLNGGGGADTLAGLGGDDVYRLFGNGETIVEAAGGGNDQAYVDGSYTLDAGASIEYLSFAVSAETSALYLNGNEMAQAVVGNLGRNTLDGGGGGDTLIGLAGDDVYRVYGPGDSVLESANGGTDAVFASGNFRLAAGSSVETLSTAENAATTNITLVGNELAQVIIGNYGNNLLDGGGGNDTLIGLEGADTYRFSRVPTDGSIVTIANFGSDDTLFFDSSFFNDGFNPYTRVPIEIGTAATNAFTRLIYNSQNGQLFHDADGTGSAAAVQIAQLPTGLTFTESFSPLQLPVVRGPSSDISTTRVAVGGDFLVGGASGTGIVLETAYPGTSTFIFGTALTTFAQPANLVFGPTSADPGHPVITFSDGYAVGSFDFSQLGTGLVVPQGGDFRTAAGDMIIARPSPGAKPGNVPPLVVGTPFDDAIDLYAPPPTSGGSVAPQDGTIRGGAGDDILRGYRMLDGGAGDDVLIGDLGTRMTGGAGADTFRLPTNTRTPGTNSGSTPNELLDYDPATDRIELVRTNNATDLAPGPLDPSRFAVGTATTPDQRIIYDPQTGFLKYDANGSLPDPSASGLSFGVFANLPAQLSLEAGSFVVIG